VATYELKPMSVKEMVGSKEWGEEQLVPHVTRVTAVVEVVRGMQGIRVVLAEWGVDVAFQGEGEEVVGIGESGCWAEVSGMGRWSCVAMRWSCEGKVGRWSIILYMRLWWGLS
jgi:hypothetical protein